VWLDMVIQNELVVPGADMSFTVPCADLRLSHGACRCACAALAIRAAELG